MARPLRLGELLVRAQVLTEQQLKQALGEQKHWGGRLGTILVRNGLVAEDTLVRALSHQLGLRVAEIKPLEISRTLVERIGRAVCEQQACLPLRLEAERGVLVLAVCDPTNLNLLDDLRRRLGFRLELELAGELQIQDALRKMYSETLEGEDGLAMAMVDNLGNPMGGALTSFLPGGRGPLGPVGLPAAIAQVPNHPAPTAPMQAPAQSHPPVPAAPPPVLRALTFPERVDEHLRLVRAVAGLLLERGVLAPEDLVPRR